MYIAEGEELLLKAMAVAAMNGSCYTSGSTQPVISLKATTPPLFFPRANLTSPPITTLIYISLSSRIFTRDRSFSLCYYTFYSFKSQNPPFFSLCLTCAYTYTRLHSFVRSMRRRKVMHFVHIYIFCHALLAKHSKKNLLDVLRAF